MADTQRRIWKGVLTAAGAAGAFMAVRSLMRWRQQRSHNMAYQQRVVQRMSSRGDRPTPNEASRQEASRQEVRSVGAPVVGVSNQPLEQPDRQPIPTTGVAQREQMNEMIMDDLAATTSPVSVDNQIGPFSAYLLAFDELIERVRSRRSESGDMLAQYSLTTEDRGWLEETLDELDDQLPEYGEGNLEEGSLQVRIYNLVTKVRDALQNREYTDADLFRINGEVRTEVCRLVSDIQRSGTLSGLERVSQVYECG